jgi:hypothetical protein
MATADPLSFQAAFIVTTFALGDSVEDARGALSVADWALAAPLVSRLTHADRVVRARALAAGLGRVVGDVELARLA